MLRVTLEIVPFGNEDRKRVLGTMEIANTTPVLSGQTGEYTCVLTSDRHDDIEHDLVNWPRKLGAWRLTHAFLQSMFGVCKMKTKGAKSQWT